MPSKASTLFCSAYQNRNCVGSIWQTNTFFTDHMITVLSKCLQWHNSDKILHDTKNIYTTLVGPLPVFIFYLVSSYWHAYQLNGIWIQQLVSCQSCRLNDRVHRVEHRVAILMKLLTDRQTMLVVVIQFFQCCTDHTQTNQHVTAR